MFLKIKNMREIKFRFWDSELKKMCFRKPLTYDFCHQNIIPLQYTGFKDANGVDIYEGDIISFTSVYDATQRKEYEVWFDEKCGSWWCKNGYELCNVIMEQHDDNWKKSQNFKIKENQYIKIIGNIYERRTTINRT